jgi:hypothetical protein
MARPSMRQLAETKNALRREEMERAVADGQLIIRSMTAREREQSDARWTAAAKARDHRAKRRQYCDPCPASKPHCGALPRRG